MHSIVQELVQLAQDHGWTIKQALGHSLHVSKDLDVLTTVHIYVTIGPRGGMRGFISKYVLYGKDTTTKLKYRKDLFYVNRFLQEGY